MSYASDKALHRAVGAVPDQVPKCLRLVISLKQCQRRMTSSVHWIHRAAARKAMINQATVRNRLLTYMTAADFALLAPFLEFMDLDRDYVLVIPNRPIEFVYFIESGMVSVVAEKRDGRSIEVGVYGREGMGASTVLLGSDQTPHHQYMQIGGSGFRLKTVDFLRVVEQSVTLRMMMLRFVHVFMTQTAQSALVNGSSIIEERLARWVLMCQDRLDTMEFPIISRSSTVLDWSEQRRPPMASLRQNIAD